MGKTNRVRKTFLVDGSWTAPAGVTTVRLKAFKRFAMATNPVGNHFGLVANDTQVCMWGTNQTGELGFGSLTSVSAPTFVSSALPLRAGYKIGMGNGHTLFLTPDGQIWSTGNNASGQLGIGSTTNQSNPSYVGPVGSKWIDVAATNGASYGIMSDGKAWSWGRNSFGELGQGNVTNTSAPNQVVGGLTFKQISAGVGNSGGSVIALQHDGTAYAWGENSYGQLGLGDTTPRSSPVLVLGGLKFAKVAAGVKYMLGLTTSGDLYSWGSNEDGNLGINNQVSHSTPILVVGGKKWIDCAAGGDGGTQTGAGGGNHAHGVATDGNAYSWGASVYGALGDNTIAAHSSPVMVVNSVGKFIQVAANSRAFYILDQEGIMLSCGQNFQGGLGDSSNVDRSSPVSVQATYSQTPVQLVQTDQMDFPVVPGTVYPISVLSNFIKFNGIPMSSTGSKYAVLEYDA